MKSFLKTKKNTQKKQDVGSNNITLVKYLGTPQEIGAAAGLKVLMFLKN